MKLFAIITAGLMAAGGGVYFYSTGAMCSKSSCGGMPVATTGGCCSGDTDDCSKNPEGVSLQDPSCSVALTNGSPSAKVSACCMPKEECCLVVAACCTVEKVAAKPVEIEGCCEACVSPTRTVGNAAKSIASVK